MNDEKLDKFVAMVESAKKIYSTGEDKDTTNRKRKRGNEDTESDISPNLRNEMQHVDVMMRATLP
jgi:hypothetical protein